MDYLGFEISQHGIGTVKSYIKPIASIPTPQTITEVKSLLGKFTYYKRFIEDFSSIAKPIIQAYTDAEKTFHKKIKKSKKFLEAIKMLKKKIASAPILAHRDWESDQLFKLRTDFSCKALAAKMVQMQKDQH